MIGGESQRCRCVSSCSALTWPWPRLGRPRRGDGPGWLAGWLAGWRCLALRGAVRWRLGGLLTCWCRLEPAVEGWAERILGFGGRLASDVMPRALACLSDSSVGSAELCSGYLGVTGGWACDWSGEAMENGRLRCLDGGFDITVSPFKAYLRAGRWSG